MFFSSTPNSYSFAIKKYCFGGIQLGRLLVLRGLENKINGEYCFCLLVFFFFFYFVKISKTYLVWIKHCLSTSTKQKLKIYQLFFYVFVISFKCV